MNSSILGRISSGGMLITKDSDVPVIGDGTLLVSSSWVGKETVGIMTSATGVGRPRGGGMLGMATAICLFISVIAGGGPNSTRLCITRELSERVFRFKAPGQVKPPIINKCKKAARRNPSPRFL